MKYVYNRVRFQPSSHYVTCVVRVVYYWLPMNCKRMLLVCVCTFIYNNVYIQVSSNNNKTKPQPNIFICQLTYRSVILHTHYIGPELHSSKNRQQEPIKEHNSARNHPFAELVMCEESGQHLKQESLSWQTLSARITPHQT